MGKTTVTLGGGVTVDDSSSTELVVTSMRLKLPWREQSAVLPGTAVPWGDTLWEAHSVHQENGGERWLLVPWAETEVVRESDRLDEERIAELEVEAADAHHARRVRGLLMYVLPVIGTLPRKVQVRLEWDYNVPAGLATITSAIAEIGLGLFLFFLIKSRTWTPSPGMAWIILLSPAMVVEGLVRMWFGLTVDEPIGSFMASPVALFVRGRKLPVSIRDDCHPTVHRVDEDSGSIELVSNEPRQDWQVGGVLRFRGRLYELIEKASLNGKSLHVFGPIEDAAEVNLTLQPPPAPKIKRDRGRGYAAECVRLILGAFAPRRVQELLAADMRLPVRLLTLISACSETIGGAVNLAGSSLAEPMVLFDILILVDGVCRLVWASVTQAPVGSILGLPFRGLYSVWVEELGGTKDGVSLEPQKGQNK